MSYKRKEFKKGDAVRFTKDFFNQSNEDFGLSGQVLYSDTKGVWKEDAERYFFLCYIEGDTLGRCVVVFKGERKHTPLILDTDIELAKPATTT